MESSIDSAMDSIVETFDDVWIVVDVPPNKHAPLSYSWNGCQFSTLFSYTMPWDTKVSSPTSAPPRNFDLSSAHELHSLRDGEDCQKGAFDGFGSSCVEAVGDDGDKKDWLLVTNPVPPLSWGDINSAMSNHEMKTMIQDIILQPHTNPWRTVERMNPDLYQVTMDFLQAEVDSPTMTHGSARAAAIKSMLAISRQSDVLPSVLSLQNIEKENNTVITGSGFADIFMGRYQNRKVCLKVLRIFADDESGKVVKWFRQEALLWRQLHHPRLLPLFGIVLNMVPSYCLVSPWMVNGNVNTFLTAHPTTDRLKMILEIIEGIEFLHTHDPLIVHADIRGANILVKDDFTCCLADFGLTMTIETRTPTYSRLGKGAAFWMSPEVWTSDDSHIPARDIYAFACTAIEVYSGTHPFPDVKHVARIIHEVLVEKKKPPRPKEIHDAALWAIMDSCLAYDAARRPTASAVYGKLRKYASRVRGHDWAGIRSFAS